MWGDFNRFAETASPRARLIVTLLIAGFVASLVAFRWWYNAPFIANCDRLHGTVSSEWRDIACTLPDGRKLIWK